MTRLINQGLGDLLDRVAARAPTPGGGSVAATVGALSAALARMVAAYSTPKNQAPTPPMAAIVARLEQIDAIFRELIDADAAAYETMTATRKSAKSDPVAAAKYQEAVMVGIGVPMQVMAASADALLTMQSLSAHASKHLLSDLGVAAVLAAAAARAARFMVLVNLPELADSGRNNQLRRDCDRIVDQCMTHSAAIETLVRGQM